MIIKGISSPPQEELNKGPPLRLIGTRTIGSKREEVKTTNIVITNGLTKTYMIYDGTAYYRRTPKTPRFRHIYKI